MNWQFLKLKVSIGSEPAELHRVVWRWWGDAVHSVPLGLFLCRILLLGAVREIVTQSPCRGTFISLTVKAEKIKRVGSVKFCFFHLKVTGIGFFFFYYLKRSRGLYQRKSKNPPASPPAPAIVRGASPRGGGGEAGNNHPPLSAKLYSRAAIKAAILRKMMTFLILTFSCCFSNTFPVFRTELRLALGGSSPGVATANGHRVGGWPHQKRVLLQSRASLQRQATPAGVPAGAPPGCLGLLKATLHSLLASWIHSMGFLVPPKSLGPSCPGKPPLVTSWLC